MGVALREVLTDYKVPVGWDSLSGTAAIDGNNALYQFLTIIRQQDGTPLMNSEGKVTSHLSGLFFRTARFLEYGIKPVYVFDGKPPDLKSTTIAKRREIRDKAGTAWKVAREEGDVAESYKQARASTRVDEWILSSSKELLTCMGIPFVDAPSEGEAQAAFMVRKGDLDFSVSQDYDSLLFGVPVLVRNLAVSGKRRIRGRTITVEPEKLYLSKILEGLGISRENLIEMSILIGTDFNAGIKGIGPKTALKIVRNNAFQETLDEKAPDFDPEPVIDFFRSPPVTEKYDISWQNPDESALRDLLCSRYEFSAERVDAVLTKMRTTAGQKTLDHWF
ncbi:flap endonuclease-1 [Methanogenium organophilum]|uniref:Flap endonuclease 1 n=1 Tax=Methanogenium organophilum TaxID=2199 RepID=A0A9X9S4G2_METOG|nr:flap endonuclease-1 [Methanogenium organophilum]WAI01312.1 flap endonuclease-1 [Methanogenium organophilum]